MSYAVKRNFQHFFKINLSILGDFARLFNWQEIDDLLRRDTSSGQDSEPVDDWT
ncbi:MAG: hypothetical protein ACK568_08945 [Pseudanabaena sp.]